MTMIAWASFVAHSVHDVTALQTEIRVAHALHLHGRSRRRVPALARQPARDGRGCREGGTPVPLARVKLLAPVARPTKLVCAPTNYQKHIEEMAAARVARGSKHTARIGEDGLFLKANSALVGPSEGNRDPVSPSCATITRPSSSS